MNIKETAVILLRIMNNQRSDYKIDENKIKLKTIEWQRLLCDLTFEQVNTALDIHFITSTYEPTIHDIRRICAEMTNGRIPTWEEAYEEVKRAVGKFGRERPQEFLDSLNLTTGEAMRLFGVKEFCNYNIEDGDGTLRAQFRDTYRNVSERESKQAQLPDRLKTLIGEIGIKQIEGDLK